MERKCGKKNCACKFDLAKLARKDLPWAQLMGSQDITLRPSSITTQEENGSTANSLVLMNLGDKFGKKIVESKQKATASNEPLGVLTLDISLETIQALVRFASEGRIDLQNLSEQTREEIWQFSISFSVPGLLKVCGQFLLENLSASNATRSYMTTLTGSRVLGSEEDGWLYRATYLPPFPLFDKQKKCLKFFPQKIQKPKSF